MNRTTRLQRAGINVSFPEEYVPLSTLLHVTDLNVTKAWQPASLGDTATRLVKLAKFLGLPQGVPGEVLISWPVSPDLDIRAAMKQAALSEDDDLASVARQFNDPQLRSAYRTLAASSRDRCAYEGMLALATLGLEDKDYNLFVGKIFGDTEHLKYAAFAFLAEAGMHERLLNTDTRIPDMLDSDELLAAMVDFATSGNVDSLDTLTQSSDWQKDVAIGYFLRGQMAKHPSLPALSYMLEKMQGASDSDVLTAYSWAAGQCVRHLGIDGAVHVLEFCRDNLNGNDKSCWLLNAVCRYTPSAEELPDLQALVDELSTGDRDIKRAVGRITDAWSGTYNLGNWMPSGYGRSIDFYERDSIVSQLKQVMIPNDEDRSNQLQTITILAQASFNTITGSAMLSAFLHANPHATGLLYKFLTDKSDNDLRKGTAIALLFTKEEHPVAPLLLRCYLGSDVGGPVPEDAGSIGEMLAYYEQGQHRDSVIGLIRMGSQELRSQVASYLNTRLLFEDRDDARENIFKLGFIFDGKQPLPQIPAMWSLSAGFEFDASLLESQFENSTPEEQQQLSQTLCSSMSQASDRKVMLALARIGAVWQNTAPEAIQPIVKRMIFEDGWVPKESGCALAASAGEGILTGSIGTEIGKRILALVSDNDSDVQREAKNACSMLNLEFVEITAEALRRNLIHGTDEYDLWVERLWEFMTTGRRNDLLGLARVSTLWNSLDVEVVAEKWLELSQHNSWVQREVMAVLLATSGTELLASSQASEIHDRIIAMTADDDSDVEREAKLACDNHGIAY